MHEKCSNDLLHTQTISAEIRTSYSCHGATFKNANISKKIYPIRESAKRSVSALLLNFHQVGGTYKQERWFDLICTHEQTSPVLNSSKCKNYSVESHNTSLTLKHVILIYEWNQIYSLEGYIHTLLLKLFGKWENKG